MATGRPVNAAVRAFLQPDRWLRSVGGRQHRVMHRIVVLAAIAMSLLSGCVALSYAFTPASSKPISARPNGCKFDLHTSTPTQGYEEIGTLKHYNGDPSS